MQFQLAQLFVLVGAAMAIKAGPVLRNPENVHTNGDSMTMDWGQEFGEKQFAWNKDAVKPGMDVFDANLARDNNSPFDMKHPVAGVPAAAPGAAPAVADPAIP